MRPYFFLFFILISYINCKSADNSKSNGSAINTVEDNVDFIVAFGSCDDQKRDNELWNPILQNNPDIWIWGGDNVYSDTDDMTVLKSDYNQQLNDSNYQKLLYSAKILGTWDDHDYGLNDGGVEFEKKDESQKEFLDFMGVEPESERRQREGVYHLESVRLPKAAVNIIILDTRYFRTALTKNTTRKKRYQPNTYGEGTILGNEQWTWLEDVLKTSKADFNIIVSSIQFLSGEHGFETWANFPHEVDRLKRLIASSQAKGVIILSGDRHISEFSKIVLDKVEFPLYDFTSSGLTHAYSNFKGEPNPYRQGEVISEVSFGLLKFQFDTKTVVMEMRGMNNTLLQKITQQY